MQNGYIELLNRTFREDILDAHQFETLEDVTILSDEWLHNYNHRHPHKSLTKDSGCLPAESHGKRMIEQEH